MCPRPTWSILQEPEYQAKNVVAVGITYYFLNPLNNASFIFMLEFFTDTHLMHDVDVGLSVLQ
jgi:hypothetical protein